MLACCFVVCVLVGVMYCSIVTCFFSSCVVDGGGMLIFSFCRILSSRFPCCSLKCLSAVKASCIGALHIMHFPSRV